MLSTRSTRKRRHVTESPEPAVVLEERRRLRNGKDLEQCVWEAFREEYVESIEQLPLSLHRRFTLLSELDIQAQSHRSALLPSLKEYAKKRITTEKKNVNIVPNEAQDCDNGTKSDLDFGRAAGIAKIIAGAKERHLKSADTLPEISSLLNDLIRASEEKVNLAQATYDTVDKHVCLLDQAIKEHDLHSPINNEGGPGLRFAGNHLRTTPTNNPMGPVKWRNKNDRTGNSVVFPSQSPQDDASLNKRFRKVPATAKGPVSDLGLRPRSNVSNINAAIDGDIDPHEPRYCYCNQVSWGEMIACDADDCEREWFHLGCAGLTEAPKGKSKWYCNACREKMSSGTRKRGY
ncbi:hypothetical protein DFH11DRAFT_983794 [Phellopilus nigrolimitatus]|nr:hypothetical protein DFH11DRAFT_983794 [Phellopilus nigrolimitatus]